MTLLYLVRHGETVDNANKIMQGQTPGELNEQGIKQAEDLAERLKDDPIDAFVSSDLQRSIHTCKLPLMERLLQRLPCFVNVTGVRLLGSISLL